MGKNDCDEDAKDETLEHEDARDEEGNEYNEEGDERDEEDDEHDEEDDEREEEDDERDEEDDGHDEEDDERDEEDDERDEEDDGHDEEDDEHDEEDDEREEDDDGHDEDDDERDEEGDEDDDERDEEDDERDEDDDERDEDDDERDEDDDEHDEDDERDEDDDRDTGAGTTYTDQFFVLSSVERGETAEVFEMDLVDRNNDGDFDKHDDDSIDGQDIKSSYDDTTVTIETADDGQITYTGAMLKLDDGRWVFTPTDGQVLQSGSLVSASRSSGHKSPLYAEDLGPVCFTPGTLIQTTQGLRPVEALHPGELILTRDHGPQPLLGLCRERFTALGAAAPVLIRKGALGNDADLIVSQQHRMLICDWRAELYCGAPEVLVAARHLVDGDAISLLPGGMVDYLHLRFAGHEIVTAAGIPSESLFPEFAALVDARSPRAALARPTLRSYEGAALAA